MSNLTEQRKFGTFEYAVLTLALGLLGLIAFVTIVPKHTGAREAAFRTHCRNNLKQIGLALHNYYDAYGCLPPPVVRDDRGNPMHSWRVLILPYLDQQALYDRYRLDEPWDGPNNRLLAPSIPDVYRCPSDRKAREPLNEPLTRYVALTGPGTAFDGSHTATFAEFTDGASTTIVVVEAPGGLAGWMEPRDTRIEQFIRDVQEKGGIHGGDTPVLLGDGGVSLMSRQIAPETLRALATIAGGEDVSEF